MLIKWLMRIANPEQNEPIKSFYLTQDFNCSLPEFRIRIRCFLPGSGSGGGLQIFLDPVCPERLDPDPVNFRADPKYQVK